MLDRLVAMLAESTIAQGTITILVTGAVVYLAVTGQPVPDILQQSFTLILGFFFGSKLALRRASLRKE